MHDMESMKKMATKEALHDLIDQLMKLEGTLPEEGEMPEGEGLPPEAVAAVEGDEASGEDMGPEMTEDELLEKKDYMQGVKKPVMKKSMTVVMGSPGMPKAMPKMMKKLKNG